MPALPNLLCDVLLNEHWSNSDANVATLTVADDRGKTRVYLDRDVEAFDDLSRYIEYGVEFLKDICKVRWKVGAEVPPPAK